MPCCRPRSLNLPALGALVALAALLAGAVGCGAETSEQRTRFALELSATAASRAGVTADDGYAVTFDRASLYVGPIRFYSGAPLFARADQAPARRAGAGFWRAVLGATSLAGTLLAVPSAQAHPGHYQEGDTLAEWLDKRRVDLLAATATPLGEASGVTGAYRSMLLTLPKPAAGQGKTLELELTAQKGGRIVRAAASFDLAREVRGIAIDEAIGSAVAGTARVEVDLRTLVARIDFEALPVATDAKAPHTAIDPESQAQNALGRGLISTDAFTARWLAAEED